MIDKTKISIPSPYVGQYVIRKLEEFKKEQEETFQTLVSRVKDETSRILKDALDGFSESLKAEANKTLQDGLNQIDGTIESRVKETVRSIPQEKYLSPRDSQELIDMISGKIPIPKNGNDGKTPTPEELTALVKQHIPKVKDGKPGKNADPNYVVGEVLKKMPQPKGVELTQEHYRQIFETIDKDPTMKFSVGSVSGLEQTLGVLNRNQTIFGAQGGVGGGGDTVRAGTGVTITTSAGVKTINATSGGTKVRDEVPFGSGTAFILANTPTANTLQLFRGGIRLQVGVGNDYTLSVASITLASALVSGEILLADYEYS